MDWINFPELRNDQLPLYQFASPHKQIYADFTAKVVKVKDGDTIDVRGAERDFDFPVRFLNTNAPEMNEEGGKESQSWLESRILGQTVDVLIDENNRVDKWGRLLGRIFHDGMDVNEESIRAGKATTFTARNEGMIPNFNKELAERRI